MIPTLLRRMLNLRRSVFIEILTTAQDFSLCHLVATVENNSLGKKKKNPKQNMSSHSWFSFGRHTAVSSKRTCKPTVGNLLVICRSRVVWVNFYGCGWNLYKYVQ